MPAVVLAVVSFAGLVGADAVTGLAQVTAFRPAAALAGAVLVALTGRWLRRAALPLLLVVVLSVTGMAPRVIGSSPGVSAAGVAGAGTELRVVTANVRYDTADGAVLARLVAEADADVVALPEASRSYAEALAARLPGYEVGGGSAVGYSSVSTAVLVRSELDPTFTDGPPGLSNSAVSATVRLGGRSVRVDAVHPAAPVPGAEPLWQADLAALLPSCAGTGPTVVLGDFNATLDHSGLRALLEAGCTDVAERTGDALRGTWPSSVPGWLGPAIDHVLVAGPLRPAGFAVHELPGSDHRALVATLAVG